MKKTNTFTNIAMFVLFAAMLVYLGVYLFRSTQQSYATAPAVLVTVSESGQASGIVVREEQVIASDKEFLSLSVDDGKEVARGGEILRVFRKNEFRAVNEHSCDGFEPLVLLTARESGERARRAFRARRNVAAIFL